jgi:RHS repeat-associated protein
MNLGYTGKPYDMATGLYNYGYRDYKPEAARFTTIDPIRDGANWFTYVNNDPVNLVDLWGLEDIVAIRAIDDNSSPNNMYYNYLVEKQFTEIEKAAKEMGMTYKFIDGQYATATQIDAEFKNNDTKRITYVYHGGPTGTMTDVNGNTVNLPASSAIGSNLQTIDLVACYADKAVPDAKIGTGISDIRSYNTPGNVIWVGETNDALNNRIPESIRTGLNNSGPPNLVPAYESVPIYGGNVSAHAYGDISNNKAGDQNAKKNK